MDEDKTRIAVLSNLVSLALLGDAEDIVTLDSLIRSFGPERTAAIQGEIDELLGVGPDLRSRPGCCAPSATSSGFASG